MYNDYSMNSKAVGEFDPKRSGHDTFPGIPSFIFPYFIPVFFIHPHHSETFAIMPVELFVMHFVRPPDSTYIRIVAPGEPFQPLVNDHFMNQEISNAIQGESGTYTDHPVLFVD